MWTLLFLFGGVAFACYLWLKSTYNYWSKKNVPTPPVNLFFGNITEAIQMKKSLGELYRDIYYNFKDYAYVGFYRIRQPGIILRDPELIKTVTVSSFSSFHDNDFDMDEKNDPMMAKNPFNIKGDRWKVVRNQITPCFSSGKIKSLFPTMMEVAGRFVKFIEKESKTAGDDGLETKNLCATFTTEDVINCAFGLEANCFNDPNSIYRQMGKKLTTPSFLQGLKMLIVMIAPPLSNLLSLKFCPPDVANFFRNLVQDIVNVREEKKIKRYDFVDNLLEVKAKDSTFTYEDLAAHAFGLFGDGFETSSIAMSFILYELASNPLKQAELRKEVDGLMARGDLTYENILALPYLDACLQEALRLNPPLPFLMKLCTQDFSFPAAKGDGAEVLIKTGTPVMIPLMGLQRDAKYFPDPDKFEPERFLGERKDEIMKCTYMPFGDGPRICLGQRFGVTQVKVGIFNVIANFELRLSNKTKVPVQMDPNYFMLAAKGGLWIKYYRRNKD